MKIFLRFLPLVFAFCCMTPVTVALGGAGTCQIYSNPRSGWVSTTTLGSQSNNTSPWCANPTTTYYEYTIPGVSAPYNVGGVIVYSCQGCIQGNYELVTDATTDTCDNYPNLAAYKCVLNWAQPVCSEGTTSCSGTNFNNTDYDRQACASESTLCFTLSDSAEQVYNLEMFTCNTCKSGFTRVAKQFNYPYAYLDEDGNDANMSCGPYTYYDCVCTKTGTEWSTGTDSSHRHTRTVVDMNTCTEHTEYKCAAGYYGNMEQPTTSSGLACISQMECDAMATIWRDMMNMTAQERIAHCTNMGAYTTPPTETGRLCEIVRSNDGVPSQCSVCTPSETCSDWTRISQEFERGACTITAADCDVSQTLKYRCAVGYYATGTSPNATQSGLKCTACPTMYDNTVPTTTSEAGQTSKEACCVDTSYSPFSDPIGTFTVSADCCWTAE